MAAALSFYNEISLDDYLLGERDVEIRHEYIEGDILVMSGASENHNTISLNIASLFLNHIRKYDLPCRPYTSDMKIKVNDNNCFYPDVMVVCGKDDEDEYYKTTPKLIIEVLSKSTRRRDKMVKRLHYQTLPSLEEYVLIEQEHCEIEILRKRDNWQGHCYYLGGNVTFESLDLTVSVEELYYQVNNEEIHTFLEKKQAEKSS